MLEITVVSSENWVNLASRELGNIDTLTDGMAEFQ